jgi:hypothetical protein
VPENVVKNEFLFNGSIVDAMVRDMFKVDKKDKLETQKINIRLQKIINTLI